MTREDFIHNVIIAQISNPNIPCKIEKIVKTAIGFANYIEEMGDGFDGTTHVLQEEVKKQESPEYEIAIDYSLSKTHSNEKKKNVVCSQRYCQHSKSCQCSSNEQDN